MKRVLLVCFWVLTVTVISSGQTLYFPHVANGVLGGAIWKTTIFLTNPAAAGSPVASGSITFFKDTSNINAAGTPFNIAVVDETGQPVGSGNTVPFQIAPGESHKYTTTGTGPYGGGFAAVNSNAPVNGTGAFSEFDLGGRLIGEAGVFLAAAVPHQAIFVDTTGGFNIGVAYANPGPGAAAVTLSLMNSSAVPVISTAQTLGAGNHNAAFTSQLFPGLPEMTGTMQITSASPLAAIALRFDSS